MFRSRTLTTALAVVVLSAMAAPAAAAEPDFAAEAFADAITITLAGEDLLEIAATAAAAVPGEAAAVGVAGALGGEPFGIAEAESDGALVTDPDGDRCQFALPAELAFLASFEAGCADASAEGDVPAASATAGVAGAGAIDLTAEELAPLFDLLAELGLVDILNDLVSQIETELLNTLLEQLRGLCIDELEELLDEIDPLGLLEALRELVADLEEASPEQIVTLLGLISAALDLLDQALPATCEALGNLAELFDGDALAGVIDGLLSADGVLDVTLLETTSSVDGSVIVATAGPAEGGAISLTLSIPGLEDLLGELLFAALEPLVDEINAVLAPLVELVEDVELLDIDQIVADLLSTDDLAGLLDGPLLSVGVAPGESSAEGDLDTLETSGTSSPALVELGGAIFALPVLAGLDDALNTAAAALDAEVLSQLAESPLGELVTVALLPGDVFEDEVAGLPGTRATSGTAEVVLLAALAESLGGPLLTIDVAAAEAAVGLEAIDDEDPVDPTVPVTPPPVTPAGPLPTTGGGLGLLALMALGAATALRRRG